MFFDLDIWHAGSPWPYLVKKTKLRVTGQKVFLLGCGCLEIDGFLFARVLYHICA